MRKIFVQDAAAVWAAARCVSRLRRAFLGGDHFGRGAHLGGTDLDPRPACDPHQGRREHSGPPVSPATGETRAVCGCRCSPRNRCGPHMQPAIVLARTSWLRAAVAESGKAPSAGCSRSVPRLQFFPEGARVLCSDRDCTWPVGPSQRHRRPLGGREQDRDVDSRGFTASPRRLLTQSAAPKIRMRLRAEKPCPKTSFLR